VYSAQGDVLHDEVALSDEVKLLDLGVAEVVADDAEDLPQPFATLGPAAWFTMFSATSSSRASSPSSCRRKSSSTTAFASAIRPYCPIRDDLRVTAVAIGDVHQS
jgi:hypothetical protein